MENFNCKLLRVFFFGDYVNNAERINVKTCCAIWCTANDFPFIESTERTFL